MNDAIKIFNSLINQCSTTMGIYEYLASNNIPIEATDLLRWQYVLAVSALDKYVHDIVRNGMIEEFKGTRPRTLKYQSMKINLSTVSLISSSPVPEIEFSNEVTRQHSFLAFQDPDKISDALSFVWDEKNKWQVISSNMATAISEKDLKTKLKNIVIRRNQIVHEGDCLSMQPPLQQQSILESDVVDVVNFIKELADAIDKSIT